MTVVLPSTRNSPALAVKLIFRLWELLSVLDCLPLYLNSTEAFNSDPLVAVRL